MKKIIALFIIVLSFYSCQKEFLDRYPTTSLVVENFYKTTDDATQALTSVYNILERDDWWSSGIISEIASDECTGGGGTGDGGGYQRYDRGLTWGDATVNQILWNTYYGGIFRANTYIANESRINWTGHEGLEKQYLAEARFLRGYMHFYLARMFGEVPYLDHTLAPDELPGRTPHKELYSDIMDDLKFCADNGISSPYPGYVSNWGRATKWAAEAMMVRVYLFYSGYYNESDLNGYGPSQAQTTIDDVIAHSGSSLVDKFASLWKVPTYSELGGDTTLAQYATEINPEVIWSVRLSGAFNYSTISRMIGPRLTNIDPYGQGWGAMPVLPTLWNLYDSTDTRRTATILDYAREGVAYDYETQGQAQYTGYQCKKYELPSHNNQVVAGANWQNDGDEDYMIIRYADVLLMAAELHLMNGDNDNALKYVNMVRQRAFGDASHNYSAVTMDDIYKERKLELACEGIRYWDILRQCKGDFSKLVSVLTYVDNSDGADLSNDPGEVLSLDVDGNNFAAHNGLFQLPQAELDLMNGVIKQNPGYE